MSDSYAHLLTDYLEGELPEDQAAAVEQHAGQCADCRVALAELRELRAAATEIADRAPARDLWPDLAERLRPASEPRVVRRSHVPVYVTTAAAALVLALLWWGVDRSPGDAQDPRGPVDAGAAMAEAWRDDVQRRALASELAPLFRDDLATYDRAVREIRAALAETPDDTYLRTHLAHTLKRQTRLLRRIDAALPPEV